MTAEVIAMRDKFENTSNGRTCGVTYEADEVIPLHRFDLPNAPVTAWKARYKMFSAGNPNGTFWLGPRRESREEATADLELVSGLGKGRR